MFSEKGNAQILLMKENPEKSRFHVAWVTGEENQSIMIEFKIS